MDARGQALALKNQVKSIGDKLQSARIRRNELFAIGAANEVSKVRLAAAARTSRNNLYKSLKGVTLPQPSPEISAETILDALASAAAKISELEAQEQELGRRRLELMTVMLQETPRRFDRLIGEDLGVSDESVRLHRQTLGITDSSQRP